MYDAARKLGPVPTRAEDGEAMLRCIGALLQWAASPNGFATDLTTLVSAELQHTEPMDVVNAVCILKRVWTALMKHCQHPKMQTDPKRNERLLHQHNTQFILTASVFPACSSELSSMDPTYFPTLVGDLVVKARPAFVRYQSVSTFYVHFTYTFGHRGLSRVPDDRRDCFARYWYADKLPDVLPGDALIVERDLRNVPEAKMEEDHPMYISLECTPVPKTADIAPVLGNHKFDRESRKIFLRMIGDLSESHLASAAKTLNVVPAEKLREQNQRVNQHRQDLENMGPDVPDGFLNARVSRYQNALRDRDDDLAHVENMRIQYEKAQRRAAESTRHLSKLSDYNEEDVRDAQDRAIEARQDSGLERHYQRQQYRFPGPKRLIDTTHHSLNDQSRGLGNHERSATASLLSHRANYRKDPAGAEQTTPRMTNAAKRARKEKNGGRGDSDARAAKFAHSVGLRAEEDQYGSSIPTSAGELPNSEKSGLTTNLEQICGVFNTSSVNGKGVGKHGTKRLEPPAANQDLGGDRGGKRRKQS